MGQQTDKTPIMELRQVSKHFGSVTALDHVDFFVYPEEIHALVGDNGAGKSTMIKCIAGAHQPSSGEMYVDGKLVTLTRPEDAFALGIATVYQHLALIPTRDIADNLFVGREPTRFGFVDRKKMVDEARALKKLLAINIPKVNSLVSRLSGGQRQAVAIGRAVHEGSRILVMDEPTAALGVRESHQMLDLIERLTGQGKTVVIISHNLAHVFRVADRITVIRGGHIVGSVLKADTTPDEVVKMITGAVLL
jgi:simple sugar transport system ATP-binding protein